MLARTNVILELNFRLRAELRDASERHEKSMLEMTRDMAEMKSLLLQLAQNRTHSLPVPTQSPFHSQASLNTVSPVTTFSRHASGRSSKKSAASRSHKKKHRKSHVQSEEDDDDKLYPVPGPYPSLPTPPRLSTTRSRSPNVTYVMPQQRIDTDRLTTASVS